VEVFCAAPPLSSGSSVIDGIRVNRLRVSRWLYGTPITPNLLLGLTSVEADIFHAGFPSPHNAFLVSLVSRLRKKPSVLTWHNDLPGVTRTAGLLVLLHDSFVLPTYIAQYSKIVATTEEYAEKSPILRRWRRKVCIVPNGVDCERFSPEVDGRPVRDALVLGDRPTAIFIGALTRWHTYKGLDILLRAFSHLIRTVQEAALMVIGDGELKSRYEKMAVDLGVRRDVFFVGDVDDSDLPSYCAASDFLVLPSKDRSEGFGLTILEANACGRPAIGSRVGGVPSVIANGHSGLLVPPYDPSSLCEAMRHLSMNVEERLRMGRNARRFAEKHDWSTVAAETESVYQKALTHLSKC